MQGDRLASGVPDLDALLEGLILGDNVVWVSDRADILVRLEDALLAEALRRGQPCFYITAGPAGPGGVAAEEALTGPDVAGLRKRLDPAVTVLDARPRGPHGDPGVLETAIVEGSRGSPPGCVVIDGLAAFSRRWGPAKAVAFFSRVCPRLFDLGALAYWRAPRCELGRASVEQITSVTQCVLEVGGDHLRVLKAEGRRPSVQGRLLRLEVTDGEVRLEDERALGRLGQGLERLRRQRGLSQSDLARMVGLTPSAISQAESGRRGLSLDTLLLLSDRVGVSIDELLTTGPSAGYVLARQQRAARESVARLFDDPEAGMRANFVRLRGGETGAPGRPHKGTELVLVASGLVQLTIGSDTPVLRAGDAVLADRSPLSGWRNLLNDPAQFFWVLRD